MSITRYMPEFQPINMSFNRSIYLAFSIFGSFPQGLNFASSKSREIYGIYLLVNQNCHFSKTLRGFIFANDPYANYFP